MNRSVVTRLRDIVPLRPLRYSEAIRLSEIQAQRFLELSAITMPAVPERIITELPKIRVTRMSPFPTSGASHWVSGTWLVAINGSEPGGRQRFSLAHEFKHIIDHRFADLIYSGLPKSERDSVVESICDYFAGCLLMPRPWLKRIYCSETQSQRELAEMFGVSQAAIATRLSQIGLTPPTPRCLTAAVDWTYEASTMVKRRRTYFRTASLVT
jgi:Zn-dependent peptidase ImmA (M78 family)